MKQIAVRIGGFVVNAGEPSFWIETLMSRKVTSSVTSGVTFLDISINLSQFMGKLTRLQCTCRKYNHLPHPSPIQALLLISNAYFPNLKGPAQQVLEWGVLERQMGKMSQLGGGGGGGVRGECFPGKV